MLLSSTCFFFTIFSIFAIDKQDDLMYDNTNK